MVPTRWASCFDCSALGIPMVSLGFLCSCLRTLRSTRGTLASCDHTAFIIRLKTVLVFGLVRIPRLVSAEILSRRSEDSSSSSLESPKRLAFEVLTGFLPFERPKRRSRDVLPSLESPLLSDGLIRLPIEGGGGDVVEPRRNGVGERDRKLNLLLRFICSAAAGL